METPVRYEGLKKQEKPGCMLQGSKNKVGGQKKQGGGSKKKTRWGVKKIKKTRCPIRGKFDRGK